MTHDQLEDLVADVPAHVSVDASAAWAGGTRRQVRARVAVGAGAVVAVVLLAAVLGVLPGGGGGAIDPADGRSGVGGYPVRIEQPWRIGDLPDAPGPLAGLAITQDSLLAITEHGSVSRVADAEPGVGLLVTPALSSDGTRIAYLSGGDRDGALVVRDLLTGGVTTYAVRGPSADGPGALLVDPQQPSWFSPDGSSVLVGTEDGYRVLRPDGSIDTASAPSRGSRPAGWVADDQVAWFREGSTVLIVADVGGRVVRRTDLELVPAEGTWAVTTSPDGSTVAYRTFPGGTSGVHAFDVVTGAPIESGFAEHSVQRCPVSWQGRRPLVSGATQVAQGIRQPSATLLAPLGTGAAVVVADPALGLECSVWATDALSGQRHAGIAGTVFGTSDLRTWWWWRDALLAVLAGLVGRFLVLPPFLRRRQLRHSSRSTP